MVPDDALPRWSDPAWKAQAMGWVVDELARHERRPEGDVEQVKARPWSTVFRVPTADGPVWFKANARGSHYEAALVAALSCWVPEQVLAPLGIDIGRGWLLLEDGGPTLREAAAGHGRDEHLASWERLLVEHARLQRALVPYAERLLSLGVPDNRPEVLPALLSDLLRDDEALRAGLPDGLTGEQRRDLDRDAAAVTLMCAELSALPIPSTLQHDDLHDNNAFCPVAPGHPARVFDWGDAVVGHPFSVLMISLATAADLAGVADGSPPMRRLRDAYLDVWSDLASHADLIEATRLALRLAGVGRAASYRRALLEATPAGRDAWGSGVPRWLLALYEPTPVEPASPLSR